MKNISSVKLRNILREVSILNSLAQIKMEDALKLVEDFEKNNLNREVLKEFTLEELKQYDGSMGKPAYVAIEGKVYDVTNNPNWGGGTHFGHYAGTDLTNEFKTAHGGSMEILNTLPLVGNLIISKP